MTRERMGALFFLALSLGYGALALQIELFPGSEHQLFTARTLPLGLAVAGIVVSFLMLVLPSRPAESAPAVAGFNWAKVAGLCVLMLFYGATITRLGFVVSTSLFLIGGILLLGERRWHVALGLSLPVALAFWALLTQLLGIYLEPGLLF